MLEDVTQLHTHVMCAKGYGQRPNVGISRAQHFAIVSSNPADAHRERPIAQPSPSLPSLQHAWNLFRTYENAGGWRRLTQIHIFTRHSSLGIFFQFNFFFARALPC